MPRVTKESHKAPGSKTHLDGGDLLNMFSLATGLFERNVDVVNALNVFPVPDGDTGTNMFLTLRDVVKEAQGAQSTSAAEVAAAMAKGALMGARGNSGVILCQVFKGIALELRGKHDFGVPELAQTFGCAREYAYKAVGQPVEGTLLTVIRSAAEAARQSADAGHTLQQTLDAICDAAREAVARTPTMLPVLRDAGVVDAGGHGLFIILEAIRLYARGEEVVPRAILPPEPVGIGAGAGEISVRFLDATDEEQFGYCTQFLVAGQGLDPEAVREKMVSMARSAVVVGDDKMVKVHIHTSEPDPVISFAATLGVLSQVKIEGMDAQHRDYSLARRQEASAQTSQVTVVAVASGQGMEEVFVQLGAAVVLHPPDGMNPSVGEILEAVEKAPSAGVIFLPNNRNIVPAANQAIGLATKTLRVVPSTTVPQGIAALLAFNPEKALDDNAKDMGRTIGQVRTGEVSRAVRPARLNGISVRKGQVIGLLEQQLVVSGSSPNDVLLALLKRAEVSSGDLVTLYWGADLSQQDADAARNQIEAAFPGVELQVVSGGQPLYYYIISIE